MFERRQSVRHVDDSLRPFANFLFLRSEPNFVRGDVVAEANVLAEFGPFTRKVDKKPQILAHVGLRHVLKLVVVVGEPAVATFRRTLRRVARRGRKTA